jgi:hypothetical protein
MARGRCLSIEPLSKQKITGWFGQGFRVRLFGARAEPCMIFCLRAINTNTKINSMKKLVFPLVAIFSLVFSISAYAQDDEIAQIQKEWGKGKKELVSMAMDLSATDSVKFWPLYNSYEKERQKLGRERIVVLSNYADHFETLTDAKADDIINKIFKNNMGLAKLQQQYYTSIKTKLGAMKAAKFMQIETYINTAIQSAVQEELPFIGELDHLKQL